jgi:glycosyltransferase involved in cell wall biosynthesis
MCPLLAKVFVWPSLYEGFGLPPLEAMAVGTPVLTSNVTSLPEVVGDSALMVNPYNIKDIAAGMELLCKNETVRERYITMGMERARGFTWDKTAQQLQTIINSFAK